jgi:L-lysine exporter family protein LysE/ArgO
MEPFVTGFLLSLSLCLDLGLVNIVTLRVSLARGATAAFALGLGSILGDLIYFVLATLGATTLLGLRPVRLGLWGFGTIVLVVLAVRAIREVIHPKDIPVAKQMPDGRRGLWKLFLTGAGLALASPTAILWFAAVGGSVIASYAAPGGDNTRVLELFAVGFVTAGIAWAALFAYGASALRRVLGANLIRGLSFASALLFLYFAADVFLRGLREF